MNAFLSQEVAQTQAISSVLIERLLECGWGQTGVLFSPDLLGALREELLSREASGTLHAAGIGKEAAQESEIRRTWIEWFNPESMTPVQRAFVEIVGELREALQQECLVSLPTFECHFALYPVGAFYRRHLDQFHAQTARVVSFVLYLNPDWQEADEGALRLFLTADGQEEAVDIPPAMGHFVLFRSDLVEHEVLATQKPRLCIVGWFKGRESNPLV